MFHLDYLASPPVYCWAHSYDRCNGRTHFSLVDRPSQLVQIRRGHAGENDPDVSSARKLGL